MNGFFLTQGVVTGFLIAVPVGPIGVLCIKRTLNFGRLSGLASGLGAAVADMCYGAVAAFGLTSISALLVGYQFWLGLTGGTFLLILGLRIFFAKPHAEKLQKRPVGFLGDFFSTLLLTLSNPMTILAFVALFAGRDVAHMCTNFYCAAALTIGVFLGSLLWWIILSFVVGIFSRRFKNKALTIINKIAGMMIIVFAFFILEGVLKR